jgi:hypothetical protein
MTRLKLAALGALLALGACAEIRGWNHDAATPVRAPGLWAVAVSYDNGAEMIPVSDICLDAASDARMTIVGAQMNRGDCSTYQASRTAHETWTVHSVCTLGPATITTDAQVVGELDGQYWVRGQSDTTGAAQPAQNGRRALAVEARRLGACPKGQRGGDVITGSRVSNLFSAAQGGG